MSNKLVSRNRKRNRITIKDKNQALELFDNNEIRELINTFFEEGVKFKVDSLDDFIDYLRKIKEFEECEDELYNRLFKIQKLIIERVEFNRDQTFNKSSDYIRNKEIDELHKIYSTDITESEKESLKEIEEEIKKDCLYSKDVELLKKILCSDNDNVIESYDEEKELKTIIINLNHKKDRKYIKSDIGTVEYHNFLKTNLERLKRLLKNMDRYFVKENDIVYRINQSMAIQDSVNIAKAIYNGREFKAISGKNDIEGYCKAPNPEECVFKSYKVNKLGQLGFGYNRVNDSEKKIIEKIHREIENKNLNEKGKLILITKWQPCASCYLVLKQFLQLHKNIDVEVKYEKNYGEK